MVLLIKPDVEIFVIFGGLYHVVFAEEEQVISRQLDKSAKKYFIALTLFGSKDTNDASEHFSFN